MEEQITSNYIKTESDFTFTGESASPWINYSNLKISQNEEQLIN